jgi:Do/DeqQ family serine protease
MRRFILFVCVVAICVFGLYRWTEEQGPERVPEKFTPAEGPKLDDEDVHVLEAADSEYTALVQAVVPSVVSITATKRIEAPEVVDPFELFFGGRFHHPRRTEEMRSLGSGVIVSKEGHIITNQHVVADVDEVSVRLSNGQEAPARVIGSDAITDIAVLKVTGIKVTPLAFADSDTVKVGQRVIAVGNPFGFDETVTQGIISAKGRAMEDSANDFFQTDAAINPGNSGGPLVDIHGEIVGINSWIISNGSGSGGWQGLGFAIPANTARRALEAIIKTGYVPHGYLGVVPGADQRAGMPQIDGAYVNGVAPGSPAEKAGIRQGDIITSIANHPVHNLSEYLSQIASVPTGSRVDVGIQRGGETITLTAKIIEQPEEDQPNNHSPPADDLPSDGANGLLAGVHVMEIPPDHEQDLPAHAHGVMVTSVDDNCPATGTLQQSDVIESIDHVPIHSVAEYQAAASALPGQEALLSICRDRRRSFTVVTAQ